MRRLAPTQIGVIAAAVLAVIVVVWFAAGATRTNADRLNDAADAAAAGPTAETRCSSQATYDLIKREVFRRAAALRGSDQAAFDKLAAYAVARMERPLVGGEEQGTGAVKCSGSLSLELPPGVAVVGGRRILTADIGYQLQPSADGNGEVLTLTRADAIVTPLATLTRVGRPAGEPLAPTIDDPAVTAPEALPPPEPGPPPIADSPVPPPPPTATARPSFNCAAARTRSEIAVCGDPDLASLDRQMAAQFGAAISRADPDTRALLERSRGRFLAYREQCPSNACIAETYRGRIREIRDIASGRLR